MSRPSPPHPNTSTTQRRASRGPTKVDNVFRWRFTSKGPRHQGAVRRFNIIYKEQGTISIIELLAHKQNPLQSKQVPGPHADAVSLRPAHALLSFIFEMVRARQAGPHALRPHPPSAHVTSRTGSPSPGERLHRRTMLGECLLPEETVHAYRGILYFYIRNTKE